MVVVVAAVMIEEMTDAEVAEVEEEDVMTMGVVETTMAIEVDETIMVVVAVAMVAEEMVDRLVEGKCSLTNFLNRIFVNF